MDKQSLASVIDLSVLRPTATGDEISRACEAACAYGFAAVCVNPVWVPLAVASVSGAGVAVAAVVGFPLGANGVLNKVHEAEQAVADGATELDVVINLGAFCEGSEDVAAFELQSVAARTSPTMLKAIIETGLLSDQQIVKAAKLVVSAGADIVKTSTGFNCPMGASVSAVRLIRQAVGNAAGIKASGGISDWTKALAMLEAGATRIGTSAGREIVDRLGEPPE